jgi:Diacylglycerol acyltransferase
METGAQLVPVFGFGNTSVYSTLTWGAGFRNWLQRRFSLALPLFYGRWFTAMPYRVPITTVVGRPIVLPRVAPGARASEADVEKWLEVYIGRLNVLYDRHKAACGYGDRTLEVL